MTLITADKFKSTRTAWKIDEKHYRAMPPELRAIVNSYVGENTNIHWWFIGILDHLIAKIYGLC
jgi:lysozyme family protein